MYSYAPFQNRKLKLFDDGNYLFECLIYIINVGRGFADVTVLGYANLTTRRLFSCTFHCDVTITLLELTDDKERKKLPISIMVFTTAALPY